MKIYNRSEFLKLPSGTLYRKGRPYCFGNIHVKDFNMGDDFVCMELGDWESDNPADWDAKCEKMRNGESVPMAEDYFGRDGCFDDKDLFLVLEKDDLLTLRVIVNDAIAVQDAAKKSSILSFFFIRTKHGDKHGK